MNLALLVAIGGHLSNAVSSLVDKWLLQKPSSHPGVYAVSISLLSVLPLIIWPFIGFEMISWFALVRALLIGACFFGGLWTFFQGLQKSEVSSYVPFTAVTVALATLFFEQLNLMSFELLHDWQVLLGIGTLILATTLMALLQHRAGKSIAWTPMIMSGVFFALSSVNASYTYPETGFFQGFLYSRIAIALCIVIVILNKKMRIALFQSGATTSSTKWFFFGQGMGAIGFFGVQYAYALTSASIVNALQAVQFGALVLITSVFGKSLPKSLQQEHTPWHMGLTIAAIVCIGLGLSLIA